MIAAIGFSALLALSLTPALCATLLKPVERAIITQSAASFGWFNRRMEDARTAIGMVRWSIMRAGRFMLIYAVLLARVAFAFVGCRAASLPVDDQGFITTDVQTPPEASFPRTLDA